MTPIRRAITRRNLIAGLGGAVLAPAPSAMAQATASYNNLPRWRGFNLIEKLTLEGNSPFQERDFDTIAQWGFDFVRLPLDYRIWTEAPGRYREAPLREIDQAVDWGRARGIQVNLCAHHVPGYVVSGPREANTLWGTDKEAAARRAEFADLWRMFAERYRGRPSGQLSFNLVNEPAHVTGQQYFEVAQQAVAAIRAQDPERLIIADGPLTSDGTRPTPELIPLKVAQSTRGYTPQRLTHYRAPWVPGSDTWAVPTWPLTIVNPFLYGDQHSDLQSPLILEGAFPAATELSLRVRRVSAGAELVIAADDAVILERRFDPHPGADEGKNAAYDAQWNIYQAEYATQLTAKLPGDARRISVSVRRGDWLTFSELRLRPPGADERADLVVVPGSAIFGERQGTFQVDLAARTLTADAQTIYGPERLRREQIEPWRELQQAGIGVHVGEFGCSPATPHAVTLAWMRDCLTLWQQAGWGWALWNLSGAAGVLDSGRADVRYEDFRGGKLDRQMLELLRQH